MEKRTKRNGFRLGILMLCTVMLLFAVMPTGVLADENVKHNVTFNVTTTEGKTVEFYAMSAKVTDNQNNEYESVTAGKATFMRFRMENTTTTSVILKKRVSPELSPSMVRV